MNELELRRTFDRYFFERIEIDKAYRKAYNYILGLYLGDGCISKHAKTFCLRIALDEKYPKIISKTIEQLILLFPLNKVNTKSNGLNCREVYVYNSFLSTIFPQHGIGKKHDRDVSLKDWQKDNIEYEELALGLFHSDGCKFLTKIKNKLKEYTYYDNYGFKNCSLDIIEIYKRCLDNLSVKYRVVTCSKSKPHFINERQIITKTQAYDVVVSKRAEVEKLKKVLGKKE